jgi:hypothetical protein
MLRCGDGRVPQNYPETQSADVLLPRQCISRLRADVTLLVPEEYGGSSLKNTQELRYVLALRFQKIISLPLSRWAFFLSCT